MVEEIGEVGTRYLFDAREAEGRVGGIGPDSAADADEGL